METEAPKAHETNDRKARYLRNWQSEVDSVAQYRALERSETDAQRAKVYAGLAAIEEKHVGFWETQLTKIGEPVPTRVPSWRARTLIYLARHLGPDSVVSTIRQQEQADQNQYVTQPESKHTEMASEERQHARTLEQIDRLAPKGVEGSFIAKMEGRHRSTGGNALRASVLGVNDGLCSNLSLVMGVAGLSPDHRTVLLTGFAGLFAGACSMALGEWLSVTNSRELAEREIQIEADELEIDPASEAEELKLIYEGKGLSSRDAEELAKKMIQDPERALDTLTREELGIDPAERGGNPTEAALLSFALFSVGAFIPLAPLLLSKAQVALYASVASGALALFFFGAVTTIFTGQPAVRSGMRQLILGLLAAGLTFVLGRLLGVSLS